MLRICLLVCPIFALLTGPANAAKPTTANTAIKDISPATVEDVILQQTKTIDDLVAKGKISAEKAGTLKENLKQIQKLKDDEIKNNGTVSAQKRRNLTHLLKVSRREIRDTATPKVFKGRRPTPGAPSAPPTFSAPVVPSGTSK